MTARDQNMSNFKNKSEVQILISSLRTGGTGIDMTMANKCILVDLWWNEAIQEQVSWLIKEMYSRPTEQFPD